MRNGRVVQHDKNEKLMVKSYLGKLIADEVETRKLKGVHITTGEVIEEVADYVGVSTNTIERLRRLGIPLLPTAVKISEYFNVAVDKIWEVKENPMWEDDRKKCRECNRTHYTSGLCYSHYSKSKKTKD